MKRLLFFAAVALGACISSCQCSEKPDVGPVEDARASATVLVSDAPLLRPEQA